jgi:twitching motility protein PilT
MRDRETIEMVLEAAEMGLIVLSTLNTIDTTKTVEKIVGSFAPEEQKTIRERFAKSFRFVISQRLIPSADGSGRLPVFEILKSNGRTRECVEKGEHDGKTLLDAIKGGEADGMQYFDGEIAKLVRSGLVDLETGVSFSSNAAVLGQELAK